jgi:hypothetical protein
MAMATKKASPGVNRKGRVNHRALALDLGRNTSRHRVNAKGRVAHRTLTKALRLCVYIDGPIFTVANAK